MAAASTVPPESPAWTSIVASRTPPGPGGIMRSSPPRYLLLGLAGRNCSVSLYDPSYFGINAHLHHHFCDDNDDNGLDDGSSNDDGLEG